MSHLSLLTLDERLLISPFLPAGVTRRTYVKFFTDCVAFQPLCLQNIGPFITIYSTVLRQFPFPFPCGNIFLIASPAFMIHDIQYCKYLYWKYSSTASMPSLLLQKEERCLSSSQRMKNSERALLSFFRCYVVSVRYLWSACSFCVCIRDKYYVGTLFRTQNNYTHCNQKGDNSW